MSRDNRMSLLLGLRSEGVQLDTDADRDLDLYLQNLDKTPEELAEPDPSDFDPPNRRVFRRQTAPFRYWKLGQGRQSRNHNGETIFHHALLDDTGAERGILSVIPRGEDLHVQWAGLHGRTIADPVATATNVIGPRGVRELHGHLAAAYPQQQYLTGLRIGGARHGKHTFDQRAKMPLRPKPRRMARGEFRGWVSPEGRFHHDESLHAASAIKHLERMGIKRNWTIDDFPGFRGGEHETPNPNDPTDTLHRLGWVRVNSAGTASVQSLKNPRTHQALLDYLSTLPREAPAYIDVADEPGFRADTVGEAIHHLLGGRRRMSRKLRYSHEAFVRAMDHDPHDTVTPQVYADWLEEHGMPTVAQHIRTHINRDEGVTQKPYHYPIDRDLASAHNEIGDRPLYPIAKAWPVESPDNPTGTGVAISFLAPTGNPHYPYNNTYFSHVLPVDQAAQLLDRFEEEGVHGVDRARENARLDRRRFARRPNQDQPRGFVEALRRLRSRQQGQVRKIASEIAQSLSFGPTQTRDALHDTPGQAVPSIAQAIYRSPDPDTVRYAAAWYGLMSQTPQLAVFHVGRSGPDSVYKWHMPGSGEDARTKLDRHGIHSRILMPKGDGFDVLVFDPRRRLRPRIAEFARSHGIVAEESVGRGEILGGDNHADARDKYRKVIEKYEGQPVSGDKPERMARPRRFAAMPDDVAGFHQAMIREGPDGITPLIYADYLDENGMPTVARIVRGHASGQGHGGLEGYNPGAYYYGHHALRDDRDPFSVAKAHLDNRAYLPGAWSAKVYYDPTNAAPHGIAVQLRQQSLGAGHPDLHFSWVHYPERGQPLIDLMHALASEGVHVDRTSFPSAPNLPQRMARVRGDRLPGGRADAIPASAFDPAELKAGIAVEREHTSDPKLAEEIARDHLAEDPHYYRKLRKAKLARPVRFSSLVDSADFHRAIVADPASPLNHLVWADYLDEKNLPHIAEVIRRAVNHPHGHPHTYDVTPEFHWTYTPPGSAIHQLFHPYQPEPGAQRSGISFSIRSHNDNRAIRYYLYGLAPDDADRLSAGLVSEGVPIAGDPNSRPRPFARPVRLARNPGEEKAFHRAMIEEGQKGFTPLVYADWLEEHGMPTVAAIIRRHAETYPYSHTWLTGANGGYDMGDRSLAPGEWMANHMTLHVPMRHDFPDRREGAPEESPPGHDLIQLHTTRPDSTQRTFSWEIPVERSKIDAVLRRLKAEGVRLPPRQDRSPESGPDPVQLARPRRFAYAERERYEPLIAGIQHHMAAIQPGGDALEQNIGNAQLAHGVFADWLEDHGDPRGQIVRRHAGMLESPDVYSKEPWFNVVRRQAGLPPVSGNDVGPFYPLARTPFEMPVRLDDGTRLSMHIYPPAAEHGETEPTVMAAWDANPYGHPAQLSRSFEALFHPDEMRQILTELPSEEGLRRLEEGLRLAASGRQLMYDEPRHFAVDRHHEQMMPYFNDLYGENKLIGYREQTLNSLGDAAANVVRPDRTPPLVRFRKRIAKKNVGKKIQKLQGEGKPHKQAIAIALSMAGLSKNK